MVRPALLLSSVAAAVLLSFGPALAGSRYAVDWNGCEVCGPYQVLEETTAEPLPVVRREMWAAQRWRPYTRFDIEGIRLHTRMP